MRRRPISFFFFFNDTATTEIYTFPYTTLFRSHRAELRRAHRDRGYRADRARGPGGGHRHRGDRKSTRLNSSHSQISYAVFCLKKKNAKMRLQQFFTRHSPSRSRIRSSHHTRSI